MSTDSILVWMLSLNREYSRLEYEQAYRLCKLCFPNESFKYEYANPDSFRLYFPTHFEERAVTNNN